ncbi:MAG: ABC transporter permease [Anaerolineae bacterium]
MPSPRRLLAITRKELRHILRDVRILLLVTVSPALLLFLLANIFAADLSTIGLGWLDMDHSQQSRAYLEAIASDSRFSVTALPSDYGEVETVLRQGGADVVVVVPRGFGADLLAGEPSAVQAVADGSDSLPAQTALGNLTSLTASYSSNLAGGTLPLEVRSRAWYNPDLKSLWSMVPGLMGIVFSLPTLALTLGIKREEETGTLEGLIASPVSGAEYQLGKLIAYVISGVVSAALAALMAMLWYGVPMRGSFLLFLLLSVEFYLASMGISLVIARIVSSQQTAMLLVLLVFFIPGFFVCGLVLPVDTTSLRSTVTAYVLPPTHLMTIARGIFLKGLGVEQLRLPIEMLGLQAIVGLTLSLALFRKRVS